MHVRTPRRALPPLLSLLALIIGLLAAPAQAAPAAADVTGGLLLRYALDEPSGTVATDSSGHGHDGTVHGTAGWSADQGLAFNGSDTYVQMPDNLLSGLDAVTVSLDVKIATGQATPYFLYGLGNTSGGNGDGYLFTTGDQYRTSIASGNWSTEQTVRRSSSYNLPREVWKHLDYTLSGGTGVLYEDGVEVARNTAVTLTPGSLGGGATTADYLGRSLYSSDKYFEGNMRDFRIYDRALSADETAVLATPVNTEAVAADRAALSLGDTSAVTGNIDLPGSGGNGSSVSWQSSDPGVVSAAGKVTRPALGQPDARVTLTATLSRGAVSQTKSFTVTVPAQYDDARATALAAAALTLPGINDVRGNITLPDTAADSTSVSWRSDDSRTIDPTGVVHRPRHGAGARTVHLTATVSRGSASATRAFTATVPELPKKQKYTGYAFSYFTGEGTADGEQIRTALSRGNDALHWRELNGGKPTLTSDLGTKGLRDPFIIRSPEGDKFYQIATDLRMYGNGDWDAAQRTGSKSIMVWESTDLVHWTDQRLVKIAPDTAGNTWAPEAYYDSSLGSYVVFWASKVYADDDPQHTGSTYNKMLYATTRDFRTFSAPKVWSDPGHSVIDSTVIQHNGTYYRFTKDERDSASASPCGKFITAEKSKDLRSTSYSFVADCIGKGTINQGEGPTVFKSNTEKKWYLFIDEFGGRGYVPFETTDLDSGTWTPSENYELPASPRHGTVLPVTGPEYQRLLSAYAPKASISDATAPALQAYAMVDDTAGTVVLPLKPNAPLSALAPEFSLAEGARISPASGTRRDFRTPQTYTVTAADGTRRTWTVEARHLRSPLLPGLNADPDIAYLDGKYWIYPTGDGYAGWSGTRFKAYSSTDLVHWKDHGVVLDLGPDVSWADSRAWAPTIAERDGKYYFYFCADTQIGVAVADSPAGPFKDALGKPLIAKGQYSGQMIDPAVFTDDDGQSYLYWGNGHAYGVPLADDMTSFDTAKAQTFTPSGFNEGSFVIKRGSTYYFSWSEDDTRSENYHVAYATGPSPLGPWTKQGTILAKRPAYGILGTGHHSIIQVPGTDDWYIAYHRFAISGPGKAGGDGTHRETTLDRLEFASDGTIKPVVPTLESIDPLRGRAS
ncbi:family 43 glycosylhydrolase [Streptomyces sp. NPDC051322]|uniref:family 43 glycosylhydrolase n=1 Tax=Streptomyces sp. NPDC051322 TaxID=3154645 RepID=UPI00344B2516